MDDFYAARSRTIPPLPWTNFAPPFSDAEFEVRNEALKDLGRAVVAVVRE